MKRIFAILLLVAAAFLTYVPSLQDGFVWDDTALVLRDPLIRSWRLIPEGFNHFLFTDATASSFYRPIQRLTYTLDYAASAFRPALYHFSSIICHTAAAIALLFLAEELLLAFEVEPKKRRLIAFIVALVWVIHPVQSAAVVYISGRADPLAAVFGFLGLYLVLRSVRTTSRNGFFLLAGATLAFLLSALSKETGLIFPVLAVAFLALLRTWAAAFKAIGVAAIVAIIYLSLRLPAENIRPPVFGPPAPLLVRPIVMARAVAEYGGLIVFPFNLHMDRDVETHPTSMSNVAWRELQTLLGILLVGGAVYWMIRARRRNPAVFSCLILAALSYLPVSGIVSLNASVAEHWIYLPTAFLFLAAAIQFADFFQNKKSSVRLVATTIFVLWFLFLGGRTFIRTLDWKDQRTFVERTIANGGDSARMLINLGSMELGEGKLTEAAEHLHAALQKAPDQPLAVINLAIAALKENDFKLARKLLDRATQMPLVDAQAYELLAILEINEKGHVDPIRFRLAARTGPPNWSIEKRYVEALDETGATPQAITELQTCLWKEWYRAESWQLLSQLLTKIGQTKEAGWALGHANDYDVHLNEH